jgi:choline dehydrogenase-like flavoprotein
MNSKTGADVVIAGTGIVGCLIAEQMLDAGLSVVMLEAGPDIDRGRIVENYRNMPPSTKFYFQTGRSHPCHGRCTRQPTQAIRRRTTSLQLVPTRRRTNRPMCDMSAGLRGIGQARFGD